jgi:hypothetical protein
VSSWDDLRLQVTPGAGVVARSSAALLVVPVVAEHQQPVLEQLIGLTRGAKPGSGRAVARKLAAIVASSEPEDVPDLALLAGLGNENVAVLVLGEAEVDAETADGHVALSGRESLTWVDRVLQAPSRIVVGMPGSPEPEATPWVDLVEGVVPGGGALLEQRGAGASGRSVRSGLSAVPAPSVDEGDAPARIDTSKPQPPAAAVAPPPIAPPPPPAPTQPGAPTDAMPAVPDELHDHPHPVPPPREDFQVESLGDAEPEQRAPLPVEPEEAAAPSDVQESDLVEGVYCKRGHFTDPDSQFCIVCGIGLYETKIKRKGVRPELGFLVFDDGSVFHLDHDYVLGRQPEVDEDVKAGTVRGLRLDDSGGTVSRAHAIVRLIGWNVTIADRKSQNGTLVAAKGSDQFVPVSRDQPITLVPGSRIQLGQRTLVYESQRGRS